MLVHLCLHFLAIDCRHSSAGAIGQLRDVALLLHREGGTLDHATLAAEAASDGQAAAIGLALGAAVALLHAPLPRGWLESLTQGTANRDLLAELIRRRVLRQRPFLDLGLLRKEAHPLGRLFPAPHYMAERYATAGGRAALLPLYRDRLRALLGLLALGLRRPWEPLGELRFSRRLRAVAPEAAADLRRH